MSVVSLIGRGCTSLCLSLILAAAVSGCGGSKPADSASPAAGIGEVIERSEGFATKPDWANENEPWSRSEGQLRVVGYVAIRGDQRMEAGNRAADSYARAELLRFLSVRIVAVLEDRVAEGEPEMLREHITETAQAVVDDLSVGARYYERRKQGSEEFLYIYSRIDVDQETVAELLRKAAANAGDLRTSPEQLVRDLKERWERFADARELNDEDLLLPAGIAKPAWAQKGDQINESGYEFVCYGLAEDEKKARLMAHARCNEKLCRVFGVQITAKSQVTETLDGVEAESQVTEQCADVRVVGRKTRYQGGECGPSGCVHWILQDYPQESYLEERKRLDQPTVIRQEVVIQEGDKHYQDPAACEESLRNYAKVADQTSEGFKKRNEYLTRAMKVCQGIDGRESGLFLALYTILTQPLPRFTTLPGSNSMDVRWAFTLASPEWRQNLDTLRFLTDRIQAVREVVAGAILPLTLVELSRNGGTAAEVDQAMVEVMKFPFVNKPASVHHQYYMHDAALSLKGKNIPYSTRYRNYLLTQAKKISLECDSSHTVSGQSVIGYLSADGSLDAQEWQVATGILTHGPLGERCFGSLLGKVDHKNERGERVEQIASMVATGAIESKDRYRTFDSLLDQLEKSEREPLFRRHIQALSGKAASRVTLAENIAESSYGWDWDYREKKKAEGLAVCEGLPKRLKSFFDDVPEADTEDTALCMCLSLPDLSSKARKGLAALLYKFARKECSWIQPEDWPGEYFKVASPKTIPFQGRTPFVGHVPFISDDIKQCIEKHSTFESVQMVSFMTATLRGRKLSGPKVTTEIYGELKNFEYKDKRRGYVNASDVHALASQMEGCIAEAAQGFEFPEVYSITREPGEHHLWFQLWGANLGTNGYVEDLKAR